MSAAGLRRAGLYGDPTGGRKKREKELSFATAWAQFAEAYPAMPLVSLAYETRDHYIPWTVFWLMYNQLPAVYAIRRINLARATSAGQALAWSKPGDALPRSIRDDIREAGFELA